MDITEVTEKNSLGQPAVKTPVVPRECVPTDKQKPFNEAMVAIAEALSQAVGAKIEWNYLQDSDYRVDYGAGHFLIPYFINGRHRYDKCNFQLEHLRQKKRELYEQLWDAGEKELVEKNFKSSDVWEIISGCDAITMNEFGGMLISRDTGDARSYRVVLSPNEVEHIARIYSEHPERHYKSWLANTPKPATG